MKNLNKLFFISMLLIFSNVIAQAPQKMSYQAIIRDNTGNLVVNQLIGMKVSILQGSISGTVSYSETHSATTNTNGLVTIEIGGGSPVTNTFAGIDWSTGSYFVKTQTDPTGGTSYTISGTSQLLSVPYALYAENTKQPGKTNIYLRGGITDAEAAIKLAKELGPNTENIYIQNTTVLTTVDLSSVTSVTDLYVTWNQALNNINLNNLTNIDNRIVISGNPGMTSVSLPGITEIFAGISISDNDNLTSIDIPNLSACHGTIYSSLNPALTSVSLPALVTLDGIEIETCPNLSTLSIGALTTVITFDIANTNLTSLSMPNLTEARLNISNNPIMTSIDFPALVKVMDNFEITGNANLTSIQLPQLAVYEVSSTPRIYIRTNKLPSSEINYLLNRFLTLAPSSGKSIDLRLQSPPAPPTGQGLIDKAALISAGNTVLTD
ncbi:hypothetical protein [Flavobacterium sp.]|uniref:hypothetical protein n=1 Tax=Flavobacterium sp. TaxID=239 RepID=UPI00286C5AE2|nr:hypothetical protein [Flavobacterium sp.]